MKNFSRIVESVENVAVLGGGAAKLTDLENALALAPRLICADGGANLALEWGIVPEKVIGDMDSAQLAPLRAAGVGIHQIDDQNSTDFEKVLACVSAPVIIGIGFLGLRLDHQLAALNALVKFHKQPVVLVDAVDICFLCPPKLSLELPRGTRVSLFPMKDSQCLSEGLVWPLDNLALSPGGQIATSNAARGGEVRIDVQEGAVICILPKAHLAQVVAALVFID